jgi:hypothetical protein
VAAAVVVVDKLGRWVEGEVPEEYSQVQPPLLLRHTQLQLVQGVLVVLLMLPHKGMGETLFLAVSLLSAEQELRGIKMVLRPLWVVQEQAEMVVVLAQLITTQMGLLAKEMLEEMG